MTLPYYHRIISLLPEPALVIAADGTVLSINEAASNVLPNHSKPRNLLQMLREDARVDGVAYLRLCARSKQPVIGSLPIQCAHKVTPYTSFGAVIEPRSESSEAIILIRLRPRTETNIKFQALERQINELNLEVSRRTAAEQALKAQTQWLEVTLKSIGDAVIITDSTNHIIFLNPVAEAMTGWDLAEANGQPLENVFVIINEYDKLPVENPAERALRERRIVALANHTILITKFGELINIEDTAAPIMIDGAVKGVILVFHDVSERKHLERQLIERANYLELANRRKNEFLTMLAHELRSPLTPISNAVQLMQLQQQGSDQPNSPHLVIERQVKHLKRLIDDMLDVSRITLGKMNVYKEQLNITDLVDYVCRDFSSQFEGADIKFNSIKTATPLWVEADADRITQVLHNILTNALKFTPAGGVVSVSLDSDGQRCILSVEDSGMGIEKAAMPDLFEPFTQAEQTLDRSCGGLGLGLSLVKGIIELHDGTVTANSDGPGKGTAVSVTLPLIEDISQHEPAADDTLTYSRHFRILLIEDDEDAAATMGQLLEFLGHEVHRAHTGPEGLTKAAAVKPCIIICDIGLPGLDGFGVAQQLKKDALTQRIPIVALTGYGESDFVTRAKQSGFIHHITKPATLSDIQDALRFAETT